MYSLLAYVVFDLQTEKGSALHEAALFGKTDVVQILLAAGESHSDVKMSFVSWYIHKLQFIWIIL